MRTLFIFIFSMQSFFVFAGKIQGKVQDEKGTLMPFVTVYIEGTTNGSTTNLQGEYFLDVEDGLHRVVYRYLGYRTEIKTIEIVKSNTINIDIVLYEESLRLRDVEITAAYEDPAYNMIRNAQKMRKFYLSQVEKFTARAYLKGNIAVKNLPKKILGEEITVIGLDKDRNGIVYLSESVANYFFEAPDKEKEVVISSKVSGSSKGFSWNSMLAFNFNFYENNIDIGISERKFLSPIAATSMLHYDYKFLGEFEEKGVKVNKIAVIPRMSGAPLFKGIIYIQEDTWRIHGVEFTLTKAQNIEYVDTVKIKQVYLPVKEGLWLKTMQTIEFTYSVSLFKVSGKGSFVGHLSNFQVGNYQKLPIVDEKNTTETAEKETEKAKIEAEKLAKLSSKKKYKAEQKLYQKKLAEKLAKSEKTISNDTLAFLRNSEKFFSAEIMQFTDSANKNSLVYWDSIRPVPLTESESMDYRLKDSMEIVIQSKPYKDSLDKKNNKLKWQDIIFGYSYQNSFKGQTYYANSLPNLLQFNTIEGIAFTPSLTYFRYDKEDRRRSIYDLDLRYGLSSKKAYGKFSINHRFNAINGMFINLEAGHYLFQYNNDNPINPLVNSLYTLLSEENYMKMYEKTYIKGTFGREIFNGVVFNGIAEFAERTELANAQTLPTIYRDIPNRVFTSNDPQNPLLEKSNIKPSRLLALTAILRFRFGQKYASYPNLKLRYATNYPTIALLYSKAINEFLGTNTGFDHLRTSVQQEINLNMLGKLTYILRVGKFWQTSKMNFIDYRHFQTSQTIFLPPSYDAFFAMPYYSNSTSDAYLEAHAEHQFGGFLLNKLPLIKKLKWNEVIGAHVLSRPNAPTYWELNAGIEKVFRVLRFDYVFSKNGDMPEAHYFRMRLKMR